MERMLLVWEDRGNLCPGVMVYLDSSLLNLYKMAGKAASQRYQIIDTLLTNRMKKYPTKDYILYCCGEKLDKSLSTSTIEKDLKVMREDPTLGYNAPIAYCKANKGYYYTDPEYTIKKLNLSLEDWETILIGIQQMANGGRIQNTVRLLKVFEKIGAQCKMDLGVEKALEKMHRLPIEMDHHFNRRDLPMAS